MRKKKEKEKKKRNFKFSMKNISPGGSVTIAGAAVAATVYAMTKKVQTTLIVLGVHMAAHMLTGMPGATYNGLFKAPSDSGGGAGGSAERNGK